METNLTKLEQVIGYEFKNQRLLTHALTHSSYANEKHWDKTKCNERLEFLGDAVLELLSSDFLFKNYASMPEGEMTKLRASLVCEPTLAFCAEAISSTGKPVAPAMKSADNSGSFSPIKTVRRFSPVFAR